MTSEDRELAPYRRCEFVTPASSDRMLAKASRSGADLFVAALEDGVSPSRKEEARRTLVRAANVRDWTGKALAFRPNGLDPPWFLDALLQVIPRPRASAGKVPRPPGPEPDPRIEEGGGPRGFPNFPIPGGERPPGRSRHAVRARRIRGSPPAPR